MSETEALTLDEVMVHQFHRIDERGNVVTENEIYTVDGDSLDEVEFVTIDLADELWREFTIDIENHGVEIET